jgi:hypothetical protein
MTPREGKPPTAASSRTQPPDITSPAPGSLPQLGVLPTEDVTADKVTYALWESFPASDAPAWGNRAA